MFFNDEKEIPAIAQKVSCSIFVVDPELKLKLKNALYLHPDDEKKTNIISIDQIRAFIAHTNNIEANERFFVITPAERMNEAAQNAFLKTFEEPKPHCHFVLLTKNPSLLLPTILSRAQIFILKTPNYLNIPPQASDKVMGYAKKIIATSNTELIAIAEEIAKTKTQPRELALDVVSTAIELLYKSYFKTKNSKFLTKIPNLIHLYEALQQNCSIKLHIIADLC